MMAKSSHPSLVWPRSDGDPSRYPKTSAPKPGGEYWYEEVSEDAPKHQFYTSSIAKHLATELKLDVDASNQYIPLPEGYKVFAHKKYQPAGDIRTDYYLFGSSEVTKFRSFPEFQDHASWLFDTSRPLNDHSTCGCRYAGGNRRQSVPGSTPKRQSNSSPLKEGSSTKRKKPVEPQENDSLPAVTPERAEELRSQRRFRRGELIWFRINTIDPPPKVTTPGLTPITHWPGLVSIVPLKSRVVNHGDTASASASSAWTSFGGTAPAALDTSKQEILHYYEYHIRPLGMFNAQDEVIKDGKDVLPWQVGCELLGGDAGWDSIGYHAEKVLKQGIKKESLKLKQISPEEIEENLLTGWKGNWGKRIKFIEMSDKYEDAVFRLSVALKTASSITNSWAQTDKIDVLPNDLDISADDIKLIMEQKKTLYQGLWWGGERIWLDDLVRLKKARQDLPAGTLLPPSEGAEERGVFFKIRVIAIEVNHDSTKPNQTGWRCLLYGDVFELAKEGTEGTIPNQEANAKSKDTTLVYQYKAPSGYAFRQLNEPEAEVTVDIIDVAGRIYPDLLDGSKQSWFIDPANPSDKEGRVEPEEGPLALAGLRNGTNVASKSTEWEEDLYSIVSKTTKTTEIQMKDYYRNLLREELGLPKLPPTLENGTNGQMGTLDQALNGLGGAIKA